MLAFADLTAELLRTQLENGLARTQLGLEDWVVDPIEGPHIRVLNLATVQPHETAREREQLVDRWEAFSSYLRQEARNLERGRSLGKVASKTAIEKVIRQLDEVLAVPVHLSPLVAVATGEGGALPPL